MTAKPFGVGSSVWVFNENRRVYAKGLGDGHLWSSSAPIWREHWEPLLVVGETRVSWIIGHSLKYPDVERKISKRDLADGKVIGVLTSAADLDAACFVHDHGRKIADRVARISGGRKAAETLRQIAALVGYEPEGA